MIFLKKKKMKAILYNRYIVECKLKLQHMSYMNEKDLIDT